MTAGRRIRRMTADDIARVVTIERASFSTPWPAEIFEGLLTRDGAELLVLDLPEAPVVGYAILWCILDQGELANIAVAEEWRGHALGSFLLQGVLDHAAERGVERLFLEVRESNVVARELYRTRGFVEVGRRADYYRSPREDARVLLKTLRSGGAEPPKDAER
ncbi:ribosomal protein S18-alanine N-acetyltransferase [Gaopeijia maritima]